jgi:SAM-dependent methyltransferase
MSHDQWFAANRAMWDERVPLHVASRLYDVESFRAGRSSLNDFEPADVGDVRGRSLVHLQCHFGMDTLSWARLGALVTGLDFSTAAIEAARALAAEIGVESEFVVANVYDAVEALSGRQFDVVYTGIGALNWLPDIRRWARVVAALTRPGGFLYLVEEHPIASVFADHDLTVTHPYFHDAAMVWDEPGSYAAPDAATVHNLSYERIHPVGDVVTALIDAGLRLAFLREMAFSGWKRWPFLKEESPGRFVFPAGMPSLPLKYALKATKPA